MRTLSVVAVLSVPLWLAACGTQDVTDAPPVEDLYTLSDAAFGEYLVHLQIPGAVVEEEGGETVYKIDTSLVDGVAELSLSKTSSAVEELTAAGLITAEDKIVDVDGLQFFTGLKVLSLTANDVVELDLTENTALEEIGINFNLVGELDLTNNAALTRLRYRGSAQAEDGQLLTDIDLSGNPELRHLYLPNHQLVTIDLSNNPLIDDVLDLSGNPGPDGDPETGDIVVPAAIYDQVPEGDRLGVVSDADVTTEVSLSSSGASMAEADGEVTLTVTLNRAHDADVPVSLTFAGTATRDADYTATAAQVTIPTGDTQATVVVSAIDDLEAEGAETIAVTLAEATGVDIGAADAVDITIEDDDLDIGLVLNEILYDPSNEGDANEDGKDDGDANGDGTYVQDEDEFIELVNVGTDPIDLSGWEVFDTSALESETPRHVFAGGTTIAPGGVLVLFGGGTPTGEFGGAQVLTTTTGAMNLNNSGDILTIRNAEGLVVLSFDIEPLSNNPNESYTRNPDLTGAFEQHADNTDLLFSPGTRIDGTPF